MPGLILGSIQFSVDELPEKINFGGQQVLAVRQFPGGGVDIQALGAFDDAIQWEGTFWFEDALQRCLTLDKMRIQAKSVQLTISTLTRTVLISKFTYDYQNDYFIPYQIEVQPVIGYGLGAAINGISTQGTLTANIASAATQSTSGSTASTSSTSSTQSTTAQSQIIHIVAAGDTLWALAVKYYKDGTQWPIIAQANGIKNPAALQIGQKLIIPNPSQGMVA